MEERMIVHGESLVCPKCKQNDEIERFDMELYRRRCEFRLKDGYIEANYTYREYVQDVDNYEDIFYCQRCNMNLSAPDGIDMEESFD